MRPGEATGAEAPCFSRPVPPLDVQLLFILEATEKSIQPVGAFDIYFMLRRGAAVAFRESPPREAALRCLREGYAEALLRAYLAVLAPSPALCPHRKADALYALPNKKSGRPSEISFAHVLALMNSFSHAIREVAPAELQPFREVYLWSAADGQGGSPMARITLPVDLTPTQVCCAVEHIPPTLSADWASELPPSSVRDGFDAMLQTLAELTTRPTPVVDPDEPLVTYRWTSDVHSLLQPLPPVYAERPNPWLETTYHKQVLCILTFYKLFTIREQVLLDCEAHCWPRDINARGFNIFHPQPIGPELVYQQCGVRLHMGDREHSRRELQHCSAAELQQIFGSRDLALREHLSDRERRTAEQILAFPFLLLAAYLEVYRQWKTTGEAQPLRDLFAAMASVSCLNLRFHAVTQRCRDILAIRTVGQVVQDAYNALLPEVDDMPLSDAVAAVRGHLARHRIAAAWDDREKQQRAIDDVDIRVSLVYLGFDPQ
eukprot:EG_transcript_7376